MRKLVKFGRLVDLKKKNLKKSTTPYRKYKISPWLRCKYFHTCWQTFAYLARSEVTALILTSLGVPSAVIFSTPLHFAKSHPAFLFLSHLSSRPSSPLVTTSPGHPSWLAVPWSTLMTRVIWWSCSSFAIRPPVSGPFWSVWYCFLKQNDTANVCFHSFCFFKLSVPIDS